MIKIGVVFFILFIGVTVMVFGTVMRNRWGINTRAVNCPQCKEAMPRVRKPKSPSQFMWGGWTCEKCGCEVDKWGRELYQS